MKMFRLTCATALLVLVQTAGASALDPEAAARAFLTPAETAGNAVTVTLGDVSQDGSDIVVKDIKTSTKAADQELSVGAVSEVRLIDVTETGNGQYAATGAVYSGMTLQVEDKLEVTIPEARIDDLKTRDADGDKVPMPVVYRSAEAGDITIKVKEINATITIDQAKFTLDDFTGDLPATGDMSVTGIKVPSGAFPPGPTSPQALGYEGDIVFAINANGRARYESSGFALEEMTVSAPEVGALTFTLDMDNYPNLLNTENPNPMEMMNVTLNSISLKYVDDSLAVRILDQMAGQQGMEREQFAQQMSMALPFMLSAINNQDFQEEVATAAGNFLMNPGTIEVNVKPEKPMSAAEIMGIAQSAPHTLPDQLNVSVEAK